MFGFLRLHLTLSLLTVLICASTLPVSAQSTGFLPFVSGSPDEAQSLNAMDPALTAVERSGPQVISASYVGVSQPLRSLAPIAPDPNSPSYLRSMQDRLTFPKTENGLSNGGLDASIVQDGPVGDYMPASVANFEGVNNVSGVLPPDTQGDVGHDPSTGKKYYIQWVNLAFQIWDVTAPAAPVSLYGPAAGNTLWAGSGTLCASHNDGDPITQFDHLANRWMMSQFALSFPNNFHQCIAISATADPMGAWYLYDFQTSTTLMNDYPKFGVWPDGYYMTVNQFNGSTTGWEGAGVAVFERSAMLSGLASRMIYIDVGAVNLDYGGMLPSDLDGPAPAAGTPNYFVEWDDTTWLGDPADTLRIWEFHTDWTLPANSTFGADALHTPNATIVTANVDPNLCGYSRNCIPQPGAAQRLDAISDRLMYRLQYRDFGAYQTLVTNHTVDSTGSDVAGIHWFELRNNGAGFAMHQEGVYTSGADNAWMGSAAMDASGNIALGYSVSSATTYPSIRYTGRLSTDPINTLPQGEATLVAGGGSQTHSAARWGDYSMMAVDASDGCTFWYTQEYYAATSSADWQTRVGSFQFPSCTTAPTGTLAGTVTDAGSVPLAGATVEVSGGYSTITDAAGHYALTLAAGTYSVTVSKYGYVSSTAPAVLVTPPGTTTQDFTLAAAPVSTISGVVTDAATGWPLYARLDITGFPGGPVFTDPVSGAYSVDLVNWSYVFTVSAMSGGYTEEVLPLDVTASATQNFGLDADAIACTAPGYEVTSPTFFEDFEAWPPAGWSIVDNIVGGGLTWNTNTFYSDTNMTGGAGLSAAVSSDANSGVEYDTELQTPVIDPTALASRGLIYKANYQQFSTEALDLDIRNVGDAGWTNILHWTEDHGAFDGLPGETVTVDLAPYVTGDFQLRWRYYNPASDPWDWYAQIDEVAIGPGCSPIASAGLVIGSVFDLNTGLLAPNASVQDAALNSAALIDASADASTPDRMYVIALAAGAQTLTASAPRYGIDTQSPTVVDAATVGQDFHLPAGNLSAVPTSLSFTVRTTAPTDSKPLTLNNSGGIAAGYEVFPFSGTWPGYVATGPFADHTRHSSPKHLNDLDSSHNYVTSRPDISPLAAGDVTQQWPTGLTYAWGIGSNFEANDLWLGDISAGGGDDLNYRFTTAGVNTGDTIDTAPWVSVFAADMTYNPYTNMLWQVNVGGDNCIYELDPATQTSTGNSICPAFGTSQRGLAYDPVTDTYYAGSWNDGIINHFAPDGAILDSAAVNLEISGLAYNPSTNHLFVLSNTDSDSTPSNYDVTVLDTADSYAIVGGFNVNIGAVHAFEDYAQAGLEIDCNGNLWAVDQAAQMVYVVDSGETGVCGLPNTWLTTAPTAGSAPGGGAALLAANVDATGMSAGTYPGYLRVVNDTPYGVEIVPVTLTVTANTAPVANNKSVTTAEDTAKAFTLTATDADGDPLTYAVVAGPSHGALSGTAPNLTYTPAANYHGPDSFTFKANDGAADSNIATVSLTVTSANDAPVANNKSVTTAEDTAKAITLTATDADGDPLTYSVVTAPSHGALSGTAPNLTYTPASNYHGPDSFTFKANDGAVDSNIATVTIAVTPANDAPVANNKSVTTAEDTAKAITLTATDADGDPLTFSVVAGPSHGALSGTAPNLTYTPAANYHGPDSFTFKANDGSVDSNIATVSIAVTPANVAPVANNRSVTTAEDTAKAITLTATDADGDPLTYSVVAGPAHGALSGTAPNLTYTPAANYHGPDSFTFKANDGSVDSNIATVSIAVTSANVAPVANNKSVTTAEDTAKAITLTATDADGDPLTYSVVAGPAHGALSGTAPNLTYTPAANYHGPDSFTFKANDGSVDSNIATVSVTVTAANNAPVADNKSVTTAENTAKAITLTATDADGDPLTYSVVAGPSHGALSGAAPNLTYTPAASYHGPDSFTFKANDGSEDSNIATVTIAVTERDDETYIGFLPAMSK